MSKHITLVILFKLQTQSESCPWKFFWIVILPIFVLSRGEPMQLLKSINPAEAGLLDAASRCHIRFRLGGERFPPLIYYKIFAHGGIVDINAFAPRDYHGMKKEQKKDTINITFDKPENDNHNGWYNRVERNGWRPISDKILTPGDRVEIETNEKPKEFHFIPQLRKKATA